MSRKLRTPKFKKKIAIEALREDKTLAQIASEHGVHSMQVSKWKRELMDGAESLFTRKRKRNDEEISREELEQKIGRLTVEIDFLKKKLGS